jgi:hypothetical protein
MKIRPTVYKFRDMASHMKRIKISFETVFSLVLFLLLWLLLVL